MKKISIIMFAVCATVFAVSCGGSGGGSNSPSAISKSICSQMQKGNYEKAFEIMFDNLDREKEPAAEERSQIVKGLGEAAKQQAEKQGGMKSFEIASENIAEDGNSATVELKIVCGDGSTETDTHRYVKKDGVWKIKFM